MLASHSFEMALCVWLISLIFCRGYRWPPVPRLFSSTTRVGTRPDQVMPLFAAKLAITDGDIHFLREICYAIVSLLTDLYWYTRSSTSGISIIGTTVQIASIVLTSIAMVAFVLLQGEEFTLQLSSKYLYMLNALFTSALMLKAITRAEIRWWKRVVPILVRAPATHSERTSQRIERRTPYHFIVVVSSSYF